MRRDPYCGNCGYSFTGLTESSKCPECGRPIVEVLTRDTLPLRAGRRYRSATTIFGRPLVHIAIGPYENESYGRARGIIAIGDIASGWLAIGGVAWGLIAVGGMAFGAVGLGGMAFALLAIGGGAVGGAAVGGGAVGGLTFGGGTIGLVAQGGGAYGYYARGDGAAGPNPVRSWGRSSDDGARFFRQHAWLFGNGRLTDPTFPLWVALCAATIAAVAATIVWLAVVQARQRATWPTDSSPQK